MKAKLRVGDRIPELELIAHDGRSLSLADFRGKQTLVLFFYPADNTPICTREVCSFRDAYQDFLRAGAAVIGVSGDSQTTHSLFAQSQRLPFVLAADRDGSLRRSFGVSKLFGLLPSRVTYVIDRDGLVRHIFRSQFSGRKHMEDALSAVRSLGVPENREA